MMISVNIMNQKIQQRYHPMVQPRASPTQNRPDEHSGKIKTNNPGETMTEFPKRTDVLRVNGHQRLPILLLHRFPFQRARFKRGSRDVTRVCVCAYYKIGICAFPTELLNRLATSALDVTRPRGSRTAQATVSRIS